MAMNYASAYTTFLDDTYLSASISNSTTFTPSRAGKHVAFGIDSRERPPLETPYEGTNERHGRFARIVMYE